jgi:hypothetical protein
VCATCATAVASNRLRFSGRHSRRGCFTTGVEEIVKRIASRHLGPEAGAAYAETAGDDLLIRLAPGILRAWDFADEFPGYH